MNEFKEKILKKIKEIHPLYNGFTANCEFLGCCQECTTCETLDKVMKLIEEID